MPLTGGGVSCPAAGSAGAKANRIREKRVERSLIAMSPGRALTIGPQDSPPCVAGSVGRTDRKGALFPGHDKIRAEESELLTVWQVFPVRKTQGRHFKFWQAKWGRVLG